MRPQIALRLLGPGRAISMILGNLRGELVVLVVEDVERVGQAAVRWAAMAEGKVVEVWQVEVVEVVKVDQIAEVLVRCSVHARPRLRICTVHCVRRASAGGGAGGKSLDLRSAGNFLRLQWWGCRPRRVGSQANEDARRARLPEVTVVSISGSPCSWGNEEAVKQTKATMYSPRGLCERGLTCCGGLERKPHALLR